MDTVGNQTTDELRPCGPIRSLGSGLNPIGQQFRVIVYPGAVKHAEPHARIGGNIDKANLLTGTSALAIFLQLVSQPKFTGCSTIVRHLSDWRSEPSRPDRPFPVPLVSE